MIYNLNYINKSTCNCNDYFLLNLFQTLMSKVLIVHLQLLQSFC